jgi:hypothetical protein
LHFSAETINENKKQSVTQTPTYYNLRLPD